MAGQVSAAAAAALEGRAVDPEPSVPAPRFIEGNRLPVGFSTVAEQAPLTRVVAQLHLENAALTHDEIAVRVSIDLAVEAMGSRLHWPQRDRVFVFVAGEAGRQVAGMAR
ncbi:hypothetical protein D3C73_854250 [compost metagenome]